MKNKIIISILICLLALALGIFIGFPISRIDLQSLLLVLVPALISAFLKRNIIKKNKDELSIFEMISRYSLYWGIIVGSFTLILIISYFSDLDSFFQDLDYVIQPILFGTIIRIIFIDIDEPKCKENPCENSYLEEKPLVED